MTLPKSSASSGSSPGPNAPHLRRPSWVRRFALALFAWMTVTFAVLPAWAQADAAPTGPRDVPKMAEGPAIEVPALPPSYVRHDMGWLLLSYPPGARERVAPLVEAADDLRAQLTADFGHPVLAHVEVRVVRDLEEMASLAPKAVPPPPYASGVAYPALKLVLLAMRAPDSAEGTDLLEVFRHELAHVALDEAVEGRHVPLWFNEGVAIHASEENRFQRMQALWTATVSKTVLPLADLDHAFPRDRHEVSVAYAEAADVVRFLLKGSDRGRFAALAARVRSGQPFDRALADAYGTDLRKLEYQWREEIAKRYTFVPILTGGSLLWVVMLGVLVLAYRKRRSRAKAILARWEREEAAADAAMRERVQLLEDGVTVVHPSARLPRIEHDGNWYTLH